MDLKSIFSPVSSELALVEQELSSLVEQMGTEALPRLRRAGILGGIVRHPFTVPGKRIRPALVLLCAKAVDGRPALHGDALHSPSMDTDGRPAVCEDDETLIQLACATEMLHAASLVHDDVIDGADTRRHQVSLNRKYGNRIAVLAGDILYTKFFSIITGMTAVDAETRVAIMNEFLDTTHAMCIGEILAQDAGNGANGNGKLRFEEYLEISSDKTAYLFRACCVTAGILRGANEEVLGALGDFGLSFGRVFQMADDLQDEDTHLDPAVDLGVRMREFAETARSQARALPPSTARDRLADLLDFVTAQVSD